MAAKKTTKSVEAQKANGKSGKKVNGDAPLGLEAVMWQAAGAVGAGIVVGPGMHRR